MKKFIKFLTCLLFAVVVGTTMCMCEHRQREVQSEDSTCVKKASYDKVFLDITDVTGFQKNMKDKLYYDSVFVNLSQNILIDVWSVCEAKGHCTQKDIVLEYLAHKDIYENIAKPKPEMNNNTDTLVSQNVDTIIDGKLYQLVKFSKTQVQDEGSNNNVR